MIYLDMVVSVNYTFLYFIYIYSSIVNETTKIIIIITDRGNDSGYSIVF